MTAYGPDDAPITFEYLAKYRKLLREFCRFHVPSLAPFEAKEHAVSAHEHSGEAHGHTTTAHEHSHK